MIIRIKVAGLIADIFLLYPKTKCLFSDYIIPMDDTEPDMVIRSSFENIQNENKITHQGSTIMVDSNEMHFFNRESHEFLFLYHQLINKIPSFHTILVHGTAVCFKGYAFLLTAPGGTGKTTRALLFSRNHPESFILNGDKPLIRMEERQVIACGSPWKGKENYGVNTEAPLKAVFLLERADHTELKELTSQEAFSFLLRQTYIPPDPANAVKAIQLLHVMSGKVRIFRFLSEPTAESVETALRAAGFA